VSEKDARFPASAPSRGPRALIFEIGSPESRCVEMPVLDVPEVPLDSALAGCARAQAPALPHVTEVEVARHYHHLATMNFGVDSGSYPLGSCTMKYNPRLNEDVCRLEGFAGLHPYQPVETIQGALGLMVGLADALAEVSGLPAAG
jgi:glycine dehydrogenase subunit 2